MTKFTVGEVPIEELSKEQQLKIREKVPNEVNKIVTQHVQQMIYQGKSKEEIDEFLGLNKAL